MQINLKKNIVSYFVIIWVIILIYFSIFDFKSFILFLILPLIYGFLLFFSIKNKIISLSIFLTLAFLSQALNPSFFFFNRKIYLEGEKWIMGNFNFDILDFFRIFANSYLLILLIFLFTIFFKKLWFKKEIYAFKKVTNRSTNQKNIKKIDYKYSYLLYIFIFLFAMPLCIFMYNNRIGISTIDPVRLPFKLVGISIYTRMLVIPSMLFILYSKSKRGILDFAVIMFFALVVGVLSLSKGIIIISLLPLIIYSYIDKTNFKLAISLLYCAILYMFISEFRQIILISNLGPIEMIKNIYNLYIESDVSNQNFFFQFVNAFTDRLYGAQYTILAHNFNLSNNFNELINFFFCRNDNLSIIIYRDIFNLAESTDSVVGVNIGYLNILILLANKNIFLLIIVSIITSFYLIIIEKIRLVLTKNKGIKNFLGYILSFIMIYFLYDGFLMKFYIILSISLFFIFCFYLFRQFQIYHRLL
jgi:hypothetical protein